MRRAVLVLSMLAMGCGPSFDEIESACVAYATCGIPGAAVQRCITDLRLGRTDAIAPASLECLLGAGSDCEAVARCAGYEIGPAAGECQPYCAGNTLVRCEPDRTLSHDCGRDGAGNLCRATMGASGAPVARCMSDLCPEVGRTERCEGDVVVSCSFGTRRIRPCPEGTACDAEGRFCVGLGPPCLADRCDGEVRVACSGGREGARTDCSRLGVACGAPGCASALPACGVVYDADATEPVLATCEGDSLLVCRSDGSTRLFDCVANGWAGCGGQACLR